MDSPSSPELTSPTWNRPNFPTGHTRFRQIFQDHWEQWCFERLEKEVPFDQRAYVNKIVLRLILCRDPEGGYARYLCPGCNFEHRVPFSCKTRFCPSCGKVFVDNWVNSISRDLLEVPHLHITLTMDDALRLFFFQQRSLLKVLLSVAPQAVMEVLESLYPGIRIGMVYVTHTAGRDLVFKPHVHIVMTKGGLVDGKWVDIDGVPGARLSAKWMYMLCKALQRERPNDQTLRRVIDQANRDHRGFQVYTESFYPQGIVAAKYVGRYLGHPPLATSHLIGYDGKSVNYWYEDTATKERQTITCSALDFISKMVPHIPPKGIQMVRYSGLYAQCIKRKCLEIANAALDSIRAQIPLFALEPLLKFVPRLKWRERINSSFGYDPLECPLCGRIMELAEIWEPKRGFVWMKRWLETHRMRKAARDALKAAEQVKQPPTRHPPQKYQQLPLVWNTS